MTRLRFLTLLLAAAAVQAQSGFHLRDNDTVVFYGDSITDQRLYTAFVETFVVTRYPQLGVRFVHSGWGGDRVSGGGGGTIDERLRRDVIPYKPTVLTIMLGMNDGQYRAIDDAIFERYRTGYEHLLAVMKEALPGLRITVLEPSPYDDVTREPTFPGGYNAVLVRYAEWVRELARRHQMTSADLNGPVVEALRQASARDPQEARGIIPDRVHPGPGGHLLMAGCLLKAWGASPTVSSVEIDAAARRVTRSDNTTVTGLTAGKTVAWTQKDAALPMPVNLRDSAFSPVLRRGAGAMELALKSSDFMETLNQQTLRLRGLDGARYTLKINGSVVGSFSREELDKGLNLAELATPMARQAAAVHALTIKRADVHQVRWRQVQVPLQADSPARVAAILDNLDALDEELAARQRAAAQPAVCYYELVTE